MSTDLIMKRVPSAFVPDEVVVHISDYDKSLIEEVLSTIELDPSSIDKATLNQVQAVSFQLPESVKEALIQFKRSPNRYGTLMFRNLPTDLHLTHTPEDGQPAKDKTSFISELCLLTFMMYLGEPIGYADEKNGQLIHDICPVKGKESNLENSGSKVFFTFHTEDAIHPYRPDHLALYCLRSDHEQKALTETSSIVHALELLPSAAVAILRKPLFKLSPPSSFNSDELSRVISVLSGSFSEPEMVIHCSLMEGVTEEAKWALELLKNALSQVAIKVALCPGDMVIIDNRLAAHARSSFVPQYDGHDRWLQRLFTVYDLRRSSFSRSPGSHVCIPLRYQLGMQDGVEFRS